MRVYTIQNVLKLKILTSTEFENVKGIAFRLSGDKVKINPPEKVVPNERMDTDLPGYAWDLLPYKNRPLDLYRAPLCTQNMILNILLR